MKIIVQQKAGQDYPIKFRWDPVFRESQERSIRSRLQLRPLDQVEIQEVS